jgi:hypothetical protein
LEDKLLAIRKHVAACVGILTAYRKLMALQGTLAVAVLGSQNTFHTPYKGRNERDCVEEVGSSKRDAQPTSTTASTERDLKLNTREKKKH